MSKGNAVAKTYAEEGLEEVTQDTAQAEAAVQATSGNTGAGTGEEEEYQQVGGLEPVAFFYRFTAPKIAPKNPYKILEKGTTLTGTYERAFTAGKFDNQTFIVRLTDGNLVGLPGATQLAKAMGKLAEGSKVKITYEGQSEIKTGKWKGQDAHNFTVFGSKLKQ